MTFTKEEARLKIQKLVDDFRAHEATLEHAPEAQIENNFIRPLFRYLNWNTENEGLSHAHYEFKVQVTNKKGLRPDYILNLDGRDVLVMDAKQVKYQMHDPRWLYQVYSYAYSTQNSKPSEKIDFAILTDFQEFIVLDCTLFAAKPEAVNNFRVIDWKYTDYVEKFDEMWELLERGNVLNDSRRGEVLSPGAGRPRPYGLWSMYLSPQKVKSNRVSPDKAFLAEMDDEKTGWRVLLAKDMKKRNPAADGELITAAVQLLIDRLVFIKALSDREVDKDYLGELAQTVESSGLTDDNAGWFKACQSIFDELNNFYNGSIFAPRPELEAVSVSNKVVREVINDLKPENSPYNFAVLPVEILGTIYERFLGRVVRTTEKQVKIEEKPEVRKAGGVYYTPQYIVDYIVENTVGKLLGESGSRYSGGGRVISEGDVPRPAAYSTRELTPADVAKLKILDPACGSGSFLLGAYSALIQWHKDYFARAGKEKRDRESFYRDESGQVRLTAKLKRDILKNNLFGVDIDPQAVEVTRFSLSLKALEDLREGELTEERTLFHQTVLPDLSANIKNGNSLIGTDYFGLFAPTSEELKQVKPFDWKTEFKEIMENGGFDCIIGNPPWGADFSQEGKEYLKTRLEVFHVRTPESFNYFIGQVSLLINPKGKSGVIIPSSFLNQHEFWKTRKHLVEKFKFLRVCNLGDGVFDRVTAPSCILAFGAKDDKSTSLFFDFRKSERGSLSIALKNEHDGQDASLIGTDSESFILQVRTDSNVIKKCYAHPPLRDTAEDVATGISSGLDAAFIHKNTDVQKLKLEKGILRKLIIGGEINRYSLQPVSGKKIIYATKEIDIEDYPNCLATLEKHKDKLKNRVETKSGVIPWYSLYRPRRKKLFELPKILIRQTADHIMASYDIDGWYCLKSGLIVQLPSSANIKYEYLLGLLNSRLIKYLYDDLVGEQSRVFPEVKPVQLFKLPIRAINFTNPAEKSQHDKMVSLVSQMLELHKSKAGAKTQSEQDVYARQIHAVDEQIDRLVYELYGLSEAEIRIVEGKT